MDFMLSRIREIESPDLPLILWVGLSVGRFEIVGLGLRQDEKAVRNALFRMLDQGRQKDQDVEKLVSWGFWRNKPRVL